MSDQSTIDLVVLRRELLEIGARVRSLQNALEPVTMGLEALETKVGKALVRVSAASGVAGPRGLRRSPEERCMMAAEVKYGAEINLEHRRNGTAEVRVNNRRPFQLSPQLGDLLAVLIAPSRFDAEGREGWRTKSEVATALNKRRASAVPASMIAGLVYKLREAFRAADENEELVECDRTLGYRVSVRR